MLRLCQPRRGRLTVRIRPTWATATEPTRGKLPLSRTARMFGGGVAMLPENGCSLPTLCRSLSLQPRCLQSSNHHETTEPRRFVAAWYEPHLENGPWASTLVNTHM